MTTPTEKLNNLFTLDHSPKQFKAWSGLIKEHLVAAYPPPRKLSPDVVHSMVMGAILLAKDSTHLLLAWEVLCSVAEEADEDGYQRGY